MPDNFLRKTLTLLAALLTCMCLSGCFLMESPTVSTNGVGPVNYCAELPNGLLGWWDADWVNGVTAYDRAASFNATMSSVSTTALGKVSNGFWFPGYGSSMTATYQPSMSPTNTMTAMAWVNPANGNLPVSAQTIMEQGARQTAFSTAASWSSYDAGNTDGAGGDKTFNSAVFDGRYVYFVPYFNGAYDGKILRYDTASSFSSAGSWSSYDASNTDGAGGDVSYWGAVFDGRYVYFVPFSTGAAHGKVLRYDTSATFTSSSSWASYDASNTDGANGCKGFEGATFDGRYVYFVPYNNGAASGKVLRYDTTASFTSASSWSSYDAANTNGANGNKGYNGAIFDGRYVYFVPNYDGAAPHGNVLRYDTTLSFSSAASWTSYNAGNTDGANGTKGFNGAIFDGRYIYFVAYYNGAYDGTFLRYDTTGGFTTAGSWTSYNAINTDGANTSKGYNGGFFDGRYVYFAPFYNNTNAYHGHFLRYDTQGGFTAAGSWSSYDASNANGANTIKGYTGAVFDGRYGYFVPYYNNAALDGEVLRYDTGGTNSAYTLRLTSRAASGTSNSTVGPGFQVTTASGTYSANSKTILSAGWHLVAGVYDGSTVSLYVDGALASSQSASGQLSSNANDLTIGAPGGSTAGIYGFLDEVQLYRAALTAPQIKGIYDAGSNGICK